MIWLVVLLILIVLALIPIGITVLYGDDGAAIRLKAGLFHFRLYPSKIKKNKQKISDKQQQESFEKEKNVHKQQGGTLDDFLAWLNIILDILGDLRKKIRISRLELHLVLAGDDPCDLSVNYGLAWAALGNLMPLLETVFTIDKRNLQIASDYTGSKTRINARMDISISFGRFLHLAVRHGIRLLREYFKQNNKRKGGATI